MSLASFAFQACSIDHSDILTAAQGKRPEIDSRVRAASLPVDQGPSIPRRVVGINPALAFQHELFIAHAAWRSRSITVACVSPYHAKTSS